MHIEVTLSCKVKVNRHIANIQYYQNYESDDGRLWSLKKHHYLLECLFNLACKTTEYLCTNLIRIKTQFIVLTKDCYNRHKTGIVSLENIDDLKV